MDIKPFEHLIEHPEFNYRQEYSKEILDNMLTEEEKEKQWFGYLDIWFIDCLQNDYFYVKQVHLNSQVFDIGVFCKQQVSLQRIYVV